jgi:hypothetical protein
LIIHLPQQTPFGALEGTDRVEVSIDCHFSVCISWEGRVKEPRIHKKKESAFRKKSVEIPPKNESINGSIGVLQIGLKIISAASGDRKEPNQRRERDLKLGDRVNLTLQLLERE